jgi:Flp pilus assembly protein TadD
VVQDRESGHWTDNVNKAPANHRGWISLCTYQLYLVNDPAAAAKNAEVALKIRPNNPDGLNCLGVSLIKLGRRDEGLALVEKSLLGHPSSPTLCSGAGAAYQECGLYEQAVTHYNTVLAFQPSNSSIHYNVAVCLTQLGRYEEAEQHFRVALSGDQGGIHILCGLGNLLHRLGRTDVSDTARPVGKELAKQGRSRDAYGCSLTALSELR